MVRQTTQYLKTLKNAEAGKESEALVEIEELAEIEVNYHSARNQFERFRWVLELFSRFEFDFRRPGNYFSMDSNFWCVQT